MKAALMLLALGLPAAAADLGGHDEPRTAASEAAPPDERRATLEELWQRRLLPPDQSSWSPKDFELLQRIRACEKEALSYLKRRGGERPWTSLPRSGAPRLTKEGYDRYVFLLSQDAILFFETKGADAKWVFKLRSADADKPLFDGSGLMTEEGLRVYRRARLNLEAFWKSPTGDVYGTRRPPTKKP